MRLKSTTIVGEETNVKKHMYAENYRDADDYKEASEGLFCIDYPVNRPFYLMGTDFGSLGGNTEAMQEYTKAFSKCFEDYFEDVKKNPTILTKEEFFKYINTNFKEFDEAKKEWENICNDSVNILVDYFNEILLEVAPIEMVTKKCNFNFLLYNPITFYNSLYEACEENNIPCSVVVMNDLWDKNDNYKGCIERMKYHLMMYSALQEKSMPLEKFFEKEKTYSLKDIYFDDVKRIFEQRLKTTYNECKQCEERFTCDHNFYWRYIEAEKEKKRIEQENKKKEKAEQKAKRKAAKKINSIRVTKNIIKDSVDIKDTSINDVDIKSSNKNVNIKSANIETINASIKDTSIRDIDAEIEKTLQTPLQQIEIVERIEEPVYIPKESLEIVRPARQDRKEEYFNTMNIKHAEKSQKTTVTYQSYLKDESLMKVSKRKISKLNINDNFLTQLNKTTD